MTKNPFINSLVASSYIVVLVLVMNWGSQMDGQTRSLLAPIAVISTFTLSAAVMAYLFLYQPVMIYFDGHKKSAVKLFLQTVAVFAATTAILLALLFFKVL